MSNFFQNAGRKFEKRITKEVGGSNTPGSGNQWYAPRDSEAGKFLIESKLTGQDHYVFELDDWFKLEQDAMKCGKMPVYIIGFFGGQEYALTHSTIWEQIVDVPGNYQLTMWKRSGRLCTRLQRLLLKKAIYRTPGATLLNCVQIEVAGEAFIIVPKQTFYNLKELIDCQ